MKKFTLTIVLSGVLFIGLSSCKKEDVLPNPDVSAIIQNGNWKITLYNDSGSDETYHFADYTFTFVNGTITAAKGSSVVSGTYADGNDDSQRKFILNFGATPPFDELNDDWHIVEETSSKIRLEDVSGGNGGTDILIFETK